MCYLRLLLSNKLRFVLVSVKLFQQQLRAPVCQQRQRRDVARVSVGDVNVALNKINNMKCVYAVRLVDMSHSCIHYNVTIDTAVHQVATLLHYMRV